MTVFAAVRYIMVSVQSGVLLGCLLIGFRCLHGRCEGWGGLAALILSIVPTIVMALIVLVVLVLRHHAAGNKPQRLAQSATWQWLFIAAVALLAVVTGATI
jgi:hypothetical protein